MFQKLKIAAGSFFHPVTLFLLAVGSVMLTVIGPFNTFNADWFWWRLLYWAGALYGATAISLVAKAFVGHLLPNAPVGVFETCVVVLTTLLFSFVLVHWTLAMFPRQEPAQVSFWYVAYYVFWITVMIALIRLAVLSVLPKPEEETSAGSARILKRLPEDFEGPILRVSVRDHFVDVVGAGTVETLRMRFSDALNELDGLEGTVTHRSHWVAKHAVVETLNDKGKTQLILVNGDQVPVSRTYRPKLSDIGML